MPALPDPPLLHRSWLLRGHFHPSPTWGLTAPPLLMDTEVTFVRDTRVQSGGSWRAGAPDEYLVAQAHVEIEESSLVSDNIENAGVGFIKRRSYLIVLPMPPDTADHPRPNERVRFTDAKGTQMNLAIDSVTMPENMPGHLEIATETWE